MKTVITIVIILLVSEMSVGSRILFLFPSPSKSHVIVAQGLSTTLAEKGHEVTFVSSFPLSKPMKNYRDIVSPVSQEYTDLATDLVKNPNQSMLSRFPQFLRLIREVGEDMMNFPEFKRLLNEEKFDLVIIGVFFNNYLLGYGDHFKCPTMMLSVGGAMAQVFTQVGNPLGVSSVPQMMTSVQGTMNFLQRLKNFLVTGFKMAATTFMDYQQKQTYE